MSRQRLRPSLAETSFITCPHCGGLGHVRSTESAAIHVLRGIEEEGAKRRAAEIMVHVATAIAMYILNPSASGCARSRQRYGMRVLLSGDDALIPPAIRIDRTRAQVPGEAMVAITPDAPPPPAPAYPEAEQDETIAADDEDEAMAEGDEAEEAASRPVPGETAEEGERRRRRRRRRRGGRRDDVVPAGETTHPPPMIADAAPPSGEDDADDDGEAENGEAGTARRCRAWRDRRPRTAASGRAVVAGAAVAAVAANLVRRDCRRWRHWMPSSPNCRFSNPIAARRRPIRSARRTSTYST